jgi:hydroxymethylpyrimidine pyrophosphatase-like HAD family hydrolase
VHLTIIACDLDGTLADGGVVAPETWLSLTRAKEAGLTIILVTGRILDDFSAEGPFTDICEAIVAEDGAVVYFPRRDEVVLPFGHLADDVVKRLSDVPVDRGLAIISTTAAYDERLLEVLREAGGGLTLEYNKDAVMALPPGATKGTGLLYALRELGYSPRNVVACGDAENDTSLFEPVELSVAVANAVTELRSHADVVLDQEDGHGVRTLLDQLIAGTIPNRHPRPERCLLLGHDEAGDPVHLDPFLLANGNLGVFGASRSGKSWLAGLIAEEMLKQGYQIFIIDPEGDYRNLRAYPHTLVMGGRDSRLPPVVDLINFSEYDGVSIVLDLSIYTIEDRYAYLVDLMHALRGLRQRRGRPHWFLVDEAQNLCPADGNELCDLMIRDMQNGGYAVVSYRPSEIDARLLKELQHCAMTRMSMPRELSALKELMQGHTGATEVIDRIPNLRTGKAFLCLAEGTSWQRPSEAFVNLLPRPRSVPHIRHMHKYLRAPLPKAKRFYFCDPSGRYIERTAASMWEFSEALRDLPLDSMHSHLQRRDFENWLREVLHDDDLADQIRKIRHRKLEGETLRDAMTQVVAARYDELDSMG